MWKINVAGSGASEIESSFFLCERWRSMKKVRVCVCVCCVCVCTVCVSIVCVYTHAYVMESCMYCVCTYVHAHIRTNTHTHTYTHTYTHTHIHMYTNSWQAGQPGIYIHSSILTHLDKHLVRRRFRRRFG